MSIIKSTTHKFQFNHMICLLVGSLLMSTSIEANIQTALTELHTTLSNLNFDVPQVNMNNPNVKANVTTLDNGIKQAVNLTSSTSAIATKIAAASPNKVMVGLDVTNISNLINGIGREIGKLQSLFSDYSAVSTAFETVKTKFTALQTKANALT